MNLKVISFHYMTDSLLQQGKDNLDSLANFINTHQKLLADKIFYITSQHCEEENDKSLPYKRFLIVRNLLLKKVTIKGFDLLYKVSLPSCRNGRAHCCSGIVLGVL